MRRLISCVLVMTLALPATAFPASTAPQHGGTCLSGDCVNGYGTVRGKSGNEYTGPWSNSWFTAGRYSMLYIEYPGQHFDLVVDAQGYPLEGTVPRHKRKGKHDSTYESSIYTGTFAKLYHRYEKKYVPRFAKGSYTDINDDIYEGDFDFVPSLMGGYYIFQGVRINKADDQVRPGLYISDLTSIDVVIGEQHSWSLINFHRATPDYLVTIQDTIQKEVQEADAVEAARLAKERESSEYWKNAFTTALGFVAVVGVVAVASRYSGSPAGVSAMGDKLRGDTTSQGATNKMTKELRERARTDPALAKRIGNATDGELVVMMQQAGRKAPASMTMAQYRNATDGSATPGGDEANAGGAQNRTRQNPNESQNQGGGASSRNTGTGVPVKVPAAKVFFRKIPADPPRGSGPGEKVKGVDTYSTEGISYSCQGINSYGKQHKEEIAQLSKAYRDADSASEEKCQFMCDLMNRREEVLTSFHYTGQWACTNTAMGQWLGTDLYSSYKDGNNYDRCTCVTAQDTPIIFSSTPK